MAKKYTRKNTKRRNYKRRNTKRINLRKKGGASLFGRSGIEKNVNSMSRTVYEFMTLLNYKEVISDFITKMITKIYENNNLKTTLDMTIEGLTHLVNFKDPLQGENNLSKFYLEKSIQIDIHQEHFETVKRNVAIILEQLQAIQKSNLIKKNNKEQYKETVSNILAQLLTALNPPPKEIKQKEINNLVNSIQRDLTLNSAPTPSKKSPNKSKKKKKK